jgi:membrane-associated PAP2 superfamily phosphatase
MKLTLGSGVYLKNRKELSCVTQEEAILVLVVVALSCVVVELLAVASALECKNAL